MREPCIRPPLDQGSRMSLACDDLEHVGVVPGSLLAPAAEAGLGGPVSGDQVESDLAKKSEVARSRPVAHAAVIFAEGDVQHPMQRVLNAPMSADRPDQDSGIIVAACEEVADLGLDPAGAVRSGQPCKGARSWTAGATKTRRRTK